MTTEALKDVPMAGLQLTSMPASILSDASRYVHSAIREEDDFADELRKKGKKVVKLSSGDPALYYPTPRYIVDAYSQALERGQTSYSRSQGVLELVDAIIGRYRARYGISMKEKDVMVTSGVAEALTFMNSALMDPGDMALILKPYYTQYPVAIQMFGGKFLLGNYDESDGWSIDLEGLAKLVKERKRGSKRIKYLLITNPNNPTGTVLPRRALEEVVELANEHRILLVSDEIYDEIVFSGASFTSVCELARGMPYLVLNGASKAFDATGFRIGYVVAPEEDRTSEELKRKLTDYCRVRLCANTPAQYAIARAMSDRAEHERTVGQMIRAIEGIVETAMKLLAENPHLSAVKPNGAFYIFPRIDMKALRLKDDRDFVHTLLEEKLVQTTRGSGFGASDHFRIVALAPKDIMSDCIQRVNEFCRQHAK
jgi:aspartate/methionine/tyrosine aminotransferase